MGAGRGARAHGALIQIQQGSAQPLRVLHFLIHIDKRLHAGHPIHSCFFPKNMWAI
jgi:hypothetical protein